VDYLVIFLITIEALALLASNAVSDLLLLTLTLIFTHVPFVLAAVATILALI
jgi:hypothetical protein